MTFLSILCALLIEQIRPLRADNPLYTGINYLAVRMEGWLNAGQASQGRVGWVLMVLALTVPTAAVYWLCAKISPVTAFAWNILIVYLTLGFRHYSHYFTSIQLALSAGDESTARELLGEWTKQDVATLDTADIVRRSVEQALITSHRNVFGVLFWFLMPIGPAGAVLYRVADHLADVWNRPDNMKSESFGHFASRAFYWIDWIPVRLTAAAFAIVGNFEDAIYAWRNFANRWKDESVGIILAAGGGAMGIRLGEPAESAGKMPVLNETLVDAPAPEPETPPGEAPTVRALQSTVGLVWRAVLLWMLLLLFLSVAVWVG